MNSAISWPSPKSLVQLTPDGCVEMKVRIGPLGWLGNSAVGPCWAYVGLMFGHVLNITSKLNRNVL